MKNHSYFNFFLNEITNNIKRYVNLRGKKISLIKNSVE